MVTVTVNRSPTSWARKSLKNDLLPWRHRDPVAAGASTMGGGTGMDTGRYPAACMGFSMAVSSGGSPTREARSKNDAHAPNDKHRHVNNR